MSKTISITFKINDAGDEADFKQAMKGKDMALALWDMDQNLWRPSWKHGYSQSEIADIIGKIDEACDKYYSNIPEADRPDARGLISQLHKLYREILDNHDVNVDDLTY